MPGDTEEHLRKLWGEELPERKRQTVESTAGGHGLICKLGVAC